MKILGTSPHAIQLSEDREEFAKLLKELDIPQPENGIAVPWNKPARWRDRIGYPVLVRPSFVLGGRGDGVGGERGAFSGIYRKGH